MGAFKIPSRESVLLPYMGVSVRVAPATGCHEGTINGKVDFADGQQLIDSCTSSRGGTTSPQTLVEWTFTPNPADVIDSSFVDGFSMPVRLEYKAQNKKYKTILGKLTETNCEEGGGYKVLDKSGSFAGCESPCSHTGDAQACCSGEYNTPKLCPPTPAVKKWCNGITAMMKNDDGKRLGYCYAYDDKHGSITDHVKGTKTRSAPRIKITFCGYA